MPFTVTLILAVLGSIILIELLYQINGSTLYERPLASLVIALIFCACIGSIEWGLHIWLSEASSRSHFRVMTSMIIVLSVSFSGILSYANTRRWCYIDNTVHSMTLMAPALLVLLLSRSS